MQIHDMKRIGLIAALLLLVAPPASAQVSGGVRQLGAVTPGDSAVWVTNNLIEDGGGAPGGGVTSFNTRTGVVVPTAGDYTYAQIGAGNAAGTVATGLSIAAGSNNTLAASTLALTGCTIGSNALCATGAIQTTGSISTSSGSIATGINEIRMTGNVSGAAWTTTGKGLIQSAATWQDMTTATGTTAAEYVNLLGSPTLMFLNTGVIITNAYNTYFSAPIAGANATLTNAWALGADSANINGPLQSAFVDLTGTIAPNLGIYAPTTTTLGFSIGSSEKYSMDGSDLKSITSGGFFAAAAAATSTVASIGPNNADTTTGLGSAGSGILDLIAGNTNTVQVTNASVAITKTAALSFVPGASQSSETLLGAPYAAGTATTNFPLLYVDTTGSTVPSTLSTAGTYIGINTASAFAGNLLDAHINGGASVFSLNYQGNLTSAGTGTFAGAVSTGSVFSFGVSGPFISYSSSITAYEFNDPTGSIFYNIQAGQINANSGLVAAGTAPTVGANQIGLGGPVVAASNCSTVAPTATGCIPVNIAGTVHYIPYQ